MDKDLQNLINEMLNKFPDGMPISGDEKYSKQEPGGDVMGACNVDEASFRVYNETLCPDMWDQYKHLDGRIRSSLLRIAYDFYEKTEFKAPILDIYLMGSIANYNWTPESDADVHIIIDFNQLQMPTDTAKEVVKTASSKWNDEHEITVKTHKIELNIQSNKEEKPYVTGIYSLIKDAWVRNPVMQRVEINKPEVQAKYAQMKKYLESVIRTGDRDAMKGAKKYLDALRQYGLDTRGELSTENLVFKILRSKGIIKMLKDAIVTTYDKEMSVKEAFMDQIPDAPYLIVGVTDGNDKSVSGITMGSEGHGNLQTSGKWTSMDNPPYVTWRYKGNTDTLYLATRPMADAKDIIRQKVPVVVDYLKQSYNISPQKITADLKQYIGPGHRADEALTGGLIGEKDEEFPRLKGEQFYLNGDVLGWRDAAGPFLIFKVAGKVHYVFGKDETITVLDGEKVEPVRSQYSGDDWGYDTSITHRQLKRVILKHFPEYEIENNKSLKVNISGRTWKYLNKAYVGVWNENLADMGFPKMMDVIRHIVYQQVGVQQEENIFFQTEDDNIISMKDFRLKHAGKLDHPDTTADQGDDTLGRKLHLMEPEEKKRALAAMGAKPKVGDQPDWQKKAELGIDEGNAEKFRVPDTDFTWGWMANEVVGPFLIFQLDGKVHYSYSDVHKTGIVNIDGKSLTTIDANDQSNPEWLADVHRDLGRVIKNYFKTEDFEHRSEEQNDKIIGRTWKSHNCAYVSFWNSDFTKVKIPNSIDIVAKIVYEQTGVSNESDVFFQTEKKIPASNGDHSYTKFGTISLKDVRRTGKLEPDDSDNEENRIAHNLHLLSPEKKKDALLAIGAKPKVDDDMPDWKKKAELGIDEIGMKDVKAKFPLPSALYKNDVNMKMMTMDNLKSMRDKTGRLWRASQDNKEDPATTHKFLDDYMMFDAELKRRMAYVNKPVGEGYGAGDPSTDPKAVGRWTVKYDSSSKVLKEMVESLAEQLLMEAPEMKTLKKNRQTLTADERNTVMAADATWHHGQKGEKSPAVWKSIVNGKTWYVTNTHRAYQAKPTLKGAIRAYHDFIKSTA